MLNLVSDPSASIKVTVRELIHTSLANFKGLALVSWAIGDVLYDFMHLVWLLPRPKIPVEVYAWAREKKIGIDINIGYRQFIIIMYFSNLPARSRVYSHHNCTTPMIFHRVKMHSQLR